MATAARPLDLGGRVPDRRGHRARARGWTRKRPDRRGGRSPGGRRARAVVPSPALRALARLAPHGAERRTAARRRELPDELEADPLVALIVGPVARLEVGGRPELVELREARG